jgi:hypothetical protein
MAKNYNLRMALRNDQQTQDTQDLKKQGAQQAAQNFINGYMATSELADLHNRLGVMVLASPDTTTVSDYSFPPFNLDITKSGLGIRVGGFKQINDKINTIQNLYRLLSGEIRTKITEWDLSLYLQELWIDDESMFDLSLLYRIFVDNPSNYTVNPSGDPDTRALVYGIVNAALSYEHRYDTYNPTADPDLQFWVPPTEDLLASQTAPRGHLVETGGGDWWQFWRHSRSYWVWDTPPATPKSIWQKNQVDIATAGGWTSWYPEYWELFFNSDDVTSASSETDVTETIQRLNKKSLKRQKSKPMKGVKPGSSLFTAPGDSGNPIGINLKSPIWEGYPYGRFPDPRSLKGYSLNSDPLPSKIDTTGSASTNINRAYPHGNPTDGINKLLDGWKSIYTETVYEEQEQTVYVPGVKNSNGGTTTGYYTTKVVTVPITSQYTAEGLFPLTTGTIIVPSSTLRTITQKLFGFVYYNSTNGNGNTVESHNGYREWGITDIPQTIDPNMTLQINSFGGPDGPTIDAMLSDNNPKPAIFVGDSFVLIAPIQRVYSVVQSSRNIRWFTWSWSNSKPDGQWVYQIDLSKAQGYSINNGSQDIGAVPLPSQFFASGKTFTAVYFELPKKTLLSTDDIITTKWPEFGIDEPEGIRIATALLSPLWWTGSVYNRSPLHRILDNLTSSICDTAEYTMNALSTLFTPGADAVIRSIVEKLPYDVQEKPETQNALYLFTNAKISGMLSQVEYLATSFSILKTAITNIQKNRGVYTVGDLENFRKYCPIVMGGLLNQDITNALQVYLNLLYEQRKIIMYARLNKESGTLMNPARAETVLAGMQDSIAPSPSPVDSLIDEKLPVVHKVTNVSIMEKAAGGVLPKEKVRIVYTPVAYTDTGEIIRPSAGTYKFYSQEVLDDSSLTPAEWYITFEQNNPNAPSIIKNVITSLDNHKLQQIMVDTNLTALEKICYARTLADWWEIKIKDDIQPPDIYYQSGMQLILTKSNEFIEQYIKMTGALDMSPVEESTKQIQLGITWTGSPTAQNTLKTLNK